MEKLLPQPPTRNTSNALSTYTSSQPTSQFRTKFASMSMHMRDRLRFLAFPPSVLSAITSTIPRYWPQGIQDTRPYAGSYEIKLRGRPWSGKGDDAVHARRLMTQLLNTLHTHGWIMTLSTDISRKITDKDTLLFRHQVPAPSPCDWMTVAFSRRDKLRFIDAPAAIHSTFIALLGSDIIQSYGPHGLPGVFDFKLRGVPWRATGEDTMVARALLLKLLEGLEGDGWTVYASIDQKATVRDDISETDTWHCCRLKGWVRGSPVYHN